MKKEEVLEKSKKDYEKNDEREAQELKKTGYIGGAVAVVVAVIFYLIATVLKGQSGYGYLAVAFSFLATSSLLNYLKIERKKSYLVAVIGWGLAFSIYTLMFILGW